MKVELAELWISTLDFNPHTSEHMWRKFLTRTRDLSNMKILHLGGTQRRDSENYTTT